MANDLKRMIAVWDRVEKQKKQDEEWNRKYGDVADGATFVATSLFIPFFVCLFSEFTVEAYGAWCGFAAFIYTLFLPTMSVIRTPTRWAYAISTAILWALFVLLV